MLRQLSLAPGVLALAVSIFVAPPAAGDADAAVRSIAFDAARLAPPDLYRHLVRNRQAFVIGIDEAAKRAQRSEQEKNPDGSGALDRAIAVRVDEAVQAIRSHRPFNDIVYRLGQVAYFLARANEPLATDRADPDEPRFARDFDRYTASTLPRLRRVFYGFQPGQIVRQGHVEALIQRTLARGRALYPLIGREYRRIGFRSGVEAFDDRSTAYAVAALSYNHAVSDLAEVLRYIWLAAGGADPRPNLPIRGRDAVRFAVLHHPPDAFTVGR